MINSNQNNGDQKQLVINPDNFPKYLPVLPINDRPVFPGMVLPYILGNHFSNDFIDFISKEKNGYIGIVLLTSSGIKRQSENKNYRLEDLHHVGCVGRILKTINTPANEIQVLISVARRFSVKTIIKNSPGLIVEPSYVSPDNEDITGDIQTYIAALISKIKELIKLNSIFSEEMKLFIARYGADNPAKLCDMAASMLTAVSAQELQDVLETYDLDDRISKVLHLIHKEVEVSKVKEKINQQIEEKVSSQQREFFLKEQLKQIQQELGISKDVKSTDIEKIEEKVKKLELTEEAKSVIDEEMDKLKVYDPRTSEYGVVRNYINWITSLPWNQTTSDNLDLDHVSKILNKDHYGLEDAKTRIVEFVAVQKMKKDMKGSIICFVGPPGVGKTSLGKSIAHALNRKFYNFSLGGMRDEAEIKGHRRTYIGAMPGKIIQALKNCGSSNPVIMMDEIDKVQSSFQGDPAAALLEVLDPEQNTFFQDHYLDIRYDLSQVLFICTANNLETIPPALLDRMEIIRIAGYIPREKRSIATRFVIPKQKRKHGFKNKDIQFKSNGIDLIIKHYAREAGVRTLEQQVQKILRKAAVAKASDPRQSVVIDKTNIKEYLGTERFKEESPYDKIVPGIVTGLAWTSLGGSVLYIESIVVRYDEGKGSFKLSGKLGEVMQESANLAYSYVTSISADYAIDKNWYKNHLVHLHVPAGATPKDGPSAGITMALSLFSLASGKKVPGTFAMTGELTISGYVLPIGGVKEKLVAARNAGKKKIILPEDNRKDVDDLPEFLTKKIKIFYVKTFRQVIEAVYN